MLPPLQPQGHSDSFKVKLSSVVKMQHDHVTDNLGHMTDPQQPPALQPRNKLSTNQNRLSAHGVPPRRPPRVPQSNLLPPTNRNSLYNHVTENSKIPGYQEDSHYHSNRTVTSDDESESDFSDEDKEYVYYVNASHV